jgi:hypothetical protein
MKKTMSRPAAVVLGCIALVLTLVLLLPINKVSAAPTTLSACVNPGNGNMRLVSSSSDCHANESFVTWNVTGPAGPPGPPGPPGSSAGGPPFVWVCTPANRTNDGSLGQAQELSVFNGGSSTANIAVNILDRDGNNLTGHTIPGASGPITTYPGDAGSSTETLAAAHTVLFNWVNPQTASPFDGITDVSFSIRVTSDQPVVVGMYLAYGTFNPSPCSLLPK